jgi:hypothetical protein
MEQITEQQDNIYVADIQQNIFWRDGAWTECVGGFHFKTSLKQVIDEITKTGLNAVGIKINDEYDIEIIVERDETYKRLYENDNNDSSDETE